MNKLVYIISIFIAFIAGSLVTYIVQTKQQMDVLLQPATTETVVTKVPSIEFENDKNVSDLNSATSNIDDSQSNTSLDNAIISNQPERVSLNDYTEDEVKAFVAKMPDFALNNYIDKFMAKGVSEALTDKRRFAERAIEELYSPNDNQQLTGIVKIGFTEIEPDSSEDTSNVTKFAKMYAHLDTKGGVPNSNIVFIKWVNNQTGQVLLFEQKAISANSNQNWVSFKPDDGWTKGSYDVRFYQFTSELTPIAQTTYEIYEVVDINNEKQSSSTVNIVN